MDPFDLALAPTSSEPADWLTRIQRSDTAAVSREMIDVWLLNALMHVESILATRRTWREILSVQCRAQCEGG